MPYTSCVCKCNINKYTYYLKWLPPMGQNFYLESPKEQMAPLEYQEESGIENWSCSQKAVLLDANTWRQTENILLSLLKKVIYLIIKRNILSLYKIWKNRKEENNRSASIPSRGGHCFWCAAFPSSFQRMSVFVQFI